jgi:Putative regulator of cell autolysis
MNNRRLVWALTALNLFISIKTYGAFLSVNLNDTIQIKYYLDLGDKVKTSQPDSGFCYYQKALSTLNKQAGQSKQKDYLLALTHLKMATYFNDVHRADEALEHNSLAMKVAEKIHSKELIAKLFNNKGQICFYKSKNDSAAFFYRKALQLALELRDQILEDKIYLNVGILKENKGETDSAFFYFKKSIVLAENLKIKELAAGAYNNLGRAYSIIGKLDEALNYYTKSKKAYEDINDLGGIILCENNIANNYFFKADYVGALERYSALVEKCKKVNDQFTLAKVYHNIGESYYNIYAFNEATNYYFKSIEIKQKLKDEKGMCTDYISMGSVQISNENPRKAIEYYNKALSILTRINYKSKLPMVYNDLGNAYLELNKPDSVAPLLQKAYDLAIEVSDNYSLSNALFYFAKLYEKTMDYKKAISYFNKTIALNEQLGDVETIAMSTYNLADIYITLGKKSKTSSEKKEYFQQASQYAMKAYKIGEKNQLLQVKSTAAKELKKVYEELGDLKQALLFANIYAETADSLYKKTQSDAAIFAEARWQAEKKQQQIKFLEQEKAMNSDLLKAKEKENRTQRTVIYLLIVGLVIILASATTIAYFVRRQRKLEFQQQLNKISMLRLENARNRVSPHFLFNSLSTIQDELSDKPDASKRLHAIVNMLRCSLLNVEKPSISLKEEVEFVNNYLLLQKAKFMDDLQAEINIENNNLLDYKIPAMILQIPVENAIKHGLAGKQHGEKVLKVNATRENGTIKISVADNGLGRSAAMASKVKGTGTGLKVINQTLHLLNSKNEKKIQFSLTDLKSESGENCGTKVDISIPVNYNFEL